MYIYIDLGSFSLTLSLYIYIFIHIYILFFNIYYYVCIYIYISIYISIHLYSYTYIYMFIYLYIDLMFGVTLQYQMCINDLNNRFKPKGLLSMWSYVFEFNGILTFAPLCVESPPSEGAACRVVRPSTSDNNSMGAAWLDRSPPARSVYKYHINK